MSTKGYKKRTIKDAAQPQDYVTAQPQDSEGLDEIRNSIIGGEKLSDSAAQQIKDWRDNKLAESEGVMVEIVYDGHGKAMLYRPSGRQFTVDDNLPTEARLTRIEVDPDQGVWDYLDRENNG